MEAGTEGLVSLEDIQTAREVVDSSPYTVRTPLLSNVQQMFPELDPSIELHLKLENMQTTGFYNHLLIKYE